MFHKRVFLKLVSWMEHLFSSSWFATTHGSHVGGQHNKLKLFQRITLIQKELHEKQGIQNVLKQVANSGKVGSCDNRGAARPLKLEGSE